MKNQILACGFIPNTESLELLDHCERVLQQESLLLFPEGTRTGWDGIVKLNRGAVSIGLRSAKSDYTYYHQDESIKPKKVIHGIKYQIDKFIMNYQLAMI